MNDEARMSKDEGMTISECSGPDFEEVFWNRETTSVVREQPGQKRIYDMEERTARFGEAVIDFAADDAVFKNEFLNSIGTCRKEARETKHFLRMTVRAVPELKTQPRTLWMEARELHLIFSKIWRSGKNQ